MLAECVRCKEIFAFEAKYEDMKKKEAQKELAKIVPDQRCTQCNGPLE